MKKDFLGNKSAIIGLVILLLIFAGFFISGILRYKKAGESGSSLNYEVVNGYKFKISKLADNIGSISRIRITPDGSTMLVATLSGNIIAFNKINGEFKRQDKPFFSLKTNLPGFPPRESGLSGLVFSADFEKSGDVFLLYSFLEDKDVLKNRITRVHFTKEKNEAYGEAPVLIFEGNTDSETSHQIEGGVGVMVKGVSHLLFNVGDATKADNAGDLKKEAGKVMLIQRDGSSPLGERPFPDYPKIQSINLRNAFDIAFNPYDPFKRFAIGDTGMDRFDRFLYLKIADLSGMPQKGLNLAWNGTEESLQLPVKDENISGSPEGVLYRWNPTETVTDVVFYPGGTGGIPSSNANESYVLLNVWGKTGSTDIQPGKKILLGKISNLNGQPKLEINDFIRRSEAGKGKLGHPLGLSVDETTGDLFFGDILEGSIYKVEPIK
mgnify:CR=1 FL=1